MLKPIIICVCLLISVGRVSAEIDVIDVDNHPQEVFPSVTLVIKDQSASYYGFDSKTMKFVKDQTKIKGELPLSGYIFAKEFVESFRVPNTLANKKNKSEFVKVFSEKDPGKMVDFLLSVNEKKRTAESEKELEVIRKIIKERKTDDEEELTPYFSTGYIELKSPKNNSERYFIKISDINKETIKLNPKKTHIDILKAVSIYSFQNILSSLNFGDIETGSNEEKLQDRLLKLNNSICTMDCPLDFTKNLSEIAMNVGKIVSFEVVGNSKIEDMDDFNKYVFAQQWCVLNNFSQGCHVSSLDKELEGMAKNKIIADLLKKYKGAEGLCSFLQK